MKGRIRVAIACAGLVLTPAAHVHAQTTDPETGSVTIGSYMLWVRGTNRTVVELFVGRGFRDAFAKAHEMDAAKLQHWIDSVRAVAPLPADDSSAIDPHAGVAIGGDVTLIRRVGGPYSGLRILVSGENPIQLAEPTARDFIAILDSAARVTRELSVPAPSILASYPTPPSASSLAAKPQTPDAVTPQATSMGSSTAEPPPELVLSAPREPVILLASRVDIMPLPLPAPIIVAPAPARKREVAAAPAAPPLPAVAPAVDSTAIALHPAARDSALPPHVDVPADKLIRTPLGPFTIPGSLLGDRDKQAQYCYTQLGLKYNPDLKGEITVKLSLGSDGAVQDAVVTKRSWQGISAGEVESCVRALAKDWTFQSTDPSIVGGAKLLTFSFAP